MSKVRLTMRLSLPTGYRGLGAEPLVRRLQSLTLAELQRHQKAADGALWNMGITFNVYGHEAGLEKVWPFDILPRIVGGEEWPQIERGLQQRIRALNLFVQDIYNGRKICQDGIVPEELVETAKTLRPACNGTSPPQGVWCHVTGTDLVRNHDGQLYVLEDNLRCPSGVSYVLENREVMKRTFPQVFNGMRVTPVEDYPEKLLDTLLHTAPKGVDSPTVAPADARYLQLRVFRAFVSGPADGHRIGRRPRSRDRRRLRSHAHHERPAAH